MKPIEIEDKLCKFIQNFGDDLNSLQLLLFFSRHPHARFNRNAVLHAPGISGNFDGATALKRLMEKKLVVASTEKSVALYYLTSEEPAHELCVKLISIDHQQWQLIGEQILNAQDIHEIL